MTTWCSFYIRPQIVKKNRKEKNEGLCILYIKCKCIVTGNDFFKFISNTGTAKTTLLQSINKTNF